MIAASSVPWRRGREDHQRLSGPCPVCPLPCPHTQTALARPGRASSYLYAGTSYKWSSGTASSPQCTSSFGAASPPRGARLEVEGVLGGSDVRSEGRKGAFVELPTWRTPVPWVGSALARERNLARELPSWLLPICSSRPRSLLPTRRTGIGCYLEEHTDKAKRNGKFLQADSR